MATVNDEAIDMSPLLLVKRAANRESRSGLSIGLMDRSYADKYVACLTAHKS
ncbi:hypothetical protein [Paenibacillus arenosi]|uniref:Uncharacterized protein n=1 Tax=Paenibacillus arenosi TaxID=2774142 RepID=A0ABR9B3X9_9BACL|nr:hypothetical protein [Paenibacillus arenosi]MBD8501069.1 hypothetical protein [Paenibacillus arenosi]